jgi:hypothetical protein
VVEWPRHVITVHLLCVCGVAAMSLAALICCFTMHCPGLTFWDLSCLIPQT